MKVFACCCLFAAARLAGAQPAAVDPGPTVELPPLLVEAENGHGPRWRYGTLPGYIILSCCEDQTTENYAVRLWQLHERFAKFIPPGFLAQFSEPNTLIYYSKQQAESLSKEMVDQIANAGRHSQTRGRVAPVPNMELHEGDFDNLFSIVNDGGALGRIFSRFDDESSSTRGLILSRDHVFALLRAHAPTPPIWFPTGVSQLYDGATGDQNLEFPPYLWTSPAELKALKQDADAPRTLLPLDELFAPHPQPGTPEGLHYVDLWRAEAELFVRWALFSGDPSSPDALWTFAKAASTRPVYESDFRAAFGMSYADARDAMSDFLPAAVQDRPSRDVGEAPPPPKLTMRDATDMEIHAIKGEWSRRTLRLIQQKYPNLLQLYSDQATKMMLVPYGKGEHDLPLVESLGLLYWWRKDETTARAFLEEAWRAHTQRPLALSSLAQLRLDEALRHPTGAGNHPSASQTGSVMEVLEAAGRLQPPQPAAAIVLTRLVVSCYPEAPSATQQDMLRAAAERFPEIAQLVLTAAVWQAREGHADEAVRLADFSISRVDDPAQRQRLIALRNVLTQTAAK